MTSQADLARREIEYWLETLPSLDINADELTAASRLARLFRVQHRLDAAVLRDFDRVGIAGPEDFRLLTLLRRTGPEGVTNAELVKQLPGSKSGTSNRLDRLVGGGLVTRSPLPHDRRTHANLLTAKGESIADELLVAIANARHELFAPMSVDEIAQFSRLLAGILEEVAPLG